MHNITFKPKPACRHNKIGPVERKNGLVKNILPSLDHEICDANEHTLLARAAFFSNMYSGSKVLSSFLLARGYSPSIVGIPATYVTRNLLAHHTYVMDTRALQRGTRSRAINAPQPRFFSPGHIIWAYHKTSDSGAKAEWIQTTVVSPEPQYLTRQSPHGRAMRIASKDVRIAPKGLLADEIASHSLEEELGYYEK